MNGQVLYTLSAIGRGKLNELFAIDGKSGTVRNIKNIDFEENNAFEIRVQASDRAIFPMTSHAKLLIEVLDVNDNSPEITVTSLLNRVKEDASIGTAIAFVSVFDRDSGKNGIVNCKISNTVPFKLELNYKNYYSLVVDGALDRERAAHYNISIRATDEGNPSLSSISFILVIVSDVNDNNPYFTENAIHVFIKENKIIILSDVNDNAPQFSEAVTNMYVRENSPVGTVLKAVYANDADASENSMVSYSIISNNNFVPLSTMIDVNSETGKIVSLQTFNYEEMKTFQFKVQATDSGVPPLRSNDLYSNRTYFAAHLPNQIFFSIILFSKI
uniref:Cadherin domain-containing protein n=1 Tax=Xiphophorus couchianus TaxID=32473 RepID=A0A3B5L0T1_9TELE